MAPLNVGLIGYGASTKNFHLPYILPNRDLRVHAFLQRAEAPPKASQTERGKHCTIDYPDAKHYRSSDEFFADPSIDVVIVCTKHDTHAEFAEKALASRKHVVVEKPFTVSTEEADRVLAVAKKSGKILAVFQNRRYDSDFLTLRDLLQRSALGTITEAEIHYDVNFPFWMSSWKSPAYEPGDGMLYGLGSHSIDQALELFGLPSTVTGFYRCLRGIESATDDAFTVILQYGGEQRNLLVTVKTSVVATMRQPLKFFVRGYDGTFIKYGEDPQELQFGAGMRATEDGFGCEGEDIWAELTTKEKFAEEQRFDERSKLWIGNIPSRRGDWLGFYADLVKAIRGGEVGFFKPEQSRNGIRIIELARQSADKQCTLPLN